MESSDLATQENSCRCWWADLVRSIEIWRPLLSVSGNKDRPHHWLGKKRINSITAGATSCRLPAIHFFGDKIAPSPFLGSLISRNEIFNPQTWEVFFRLVFFEDFIACWSGGTTAKFVESNVLFHDTGRFVAIGVSTTIADECTAASHARFIFGANNGRALCVVIGEWHAGSE